jgi:hypothetical protein
VEDDDTDSNAFARQATSAVAEHSPRGFRIDGWTLYKTKNLRISNISSIKGTFERCLVPPPCQRKFFPSIIKGDEEKQIFLEPKCNRQTATEVLDTQREEHLIKILKAEREALDKKSKEGFEGVRKEMNRLVKLAATLELAYEVTENREEAGIQQRIDAMASEE